MKAQSYLEVIESIIQKRKKEFRDALLSAYTKEEMKLLLKDYFELDYDRVIVQSHNTIESEFEQLIDYFERKGELSQLLDKVFDKQSKNLKLSKFHNSIINDIDSCELKDEISPEILEKIGKSLVEGKLIFFLGSGINDYYDKNTENLPPSDIDIANHLAKQLVNNQDFKKVIGLPCQVCPAKLEERPDSSCPIWQEINENCGKSKQLEHEQNLAFAKLQMHCLSQCLLNNGEHSLKESVRKIFRDNYNIHPYQPNKVQNSLAALAKKIAKSNNLFNFFILTTNYDVGLEKAFEKELDFDVVHYFIDRLKFTGNFLYKSYFCNGNQNDEDSLKELANKEEQLFKTPIIFKLYGGIVYKAKEEFDSFAIAESHFINYLQRPTEKFPEDWKLYLENSNILFLGCNPNDVNIFALLHQFFPSKFSLSKPRPEGWLISRLKPGNMRDTDIWKQMGITFLDKCSSDYLLSELQNYVEKYFSK
ncbi:hypothetical protein F7734_14485 [Scytonema sp. UIC 10036]|uniref:SIR2 family protein n=1 Tax=Scytonema sp. UIC 10036 TaxID=2304196 RepID=UPI0012DA3F92|nr:SIR2 family protein [Scytonema sp. UIC 10036]MUG93567.1 hypothetical protein [Scytonema sp. UIC 10036]